MHPGLLPLEILRKLPGNKNESNTKRISQKHSKSSSSSSQAMSLSLKKCTSDGFCKRSRKRGGTHNSTEVAHNPSRTGQYMSEINVENSRFKNTDFPLAPQNFNDDKFQLSFEKLKKVSFESSVNGDKSNVYTDDLRRGERLASIPSTMAERQKMALFETRLERALNLWPKMETQDNLMERSMLDFKHSEEEMVDSLKSPCFPIPAEVYDQGTYNGLFVLPWMSELKRRFPRHVLTRNVKLALKRHPTTDWLEDPEGENVPLFLVNWGIVQDPQASKRRQKEKQEAEKWQEDTHEAYSHQVFAESVYIEKTRELLGISSLNSGASSTSELKSFSSDVYSESASTKQGQQQRRRPILKTYHLSRENLSDENPLSSASSEDSILGEYNLINQQKLRRQAQASGESSSGISSRESGSPERQGFPVDAIRKSTYGKNEMSESIASLVEYFKSISYTNGYGV